MNEQTSFKLPIQLTEVKEAFSISKNNQICGLDDIPNELLRNSAAVCSFLHKMFYIIFKKEDIPQEWLNGILININKGNCNSELLTNKRSISLISNVDKVFERILNPCVIQNLPFSEAKQKYNRTNIFSESSRIATII